MKRREKFKIRIMKSSLATVLKMPSSSQKDLRLSLQALKIVFKCSKIASQSPREKEKAKYENDAAVTMILNVL